MQGEAEIKTSALIKPLFGIVYPLKIDYNYTDNRILREEQ